MPRKAKVGLAIAVAGLTAFLGLSSVAWSSTTQVSVQSAPLQPNRQMTERFLKRDAGRLRAAFCAGQNARRLHCKPAAGKPLGGRPKLFLSHTKPTDPACPSWEVKKPVAFWATVATSASAICVDTVWFHDFTGAEFSESQSPETAILNEWDLTGGKWVRKAHQAASFGNCIVIPVSFPFGLFTVDHVKWCSASLGVNAGLFPAPGTYKGELTVITQRPFWTGAVMVDAHSEHLCYFC